MLNDRTAQFVVAAMALLAILGLFVLVGETRRHVLDNAATDGARAA